MADDNSKLEEAVNDNESKSFMRKAFDLGFNTAFAAGATVLGMATVGTAAPLISGALGAGLFIGGMFNKEKSLYNTINDAVKGYAAVNTVLAPIIWLGDVTYPLFNFSNELYNVIGRSVYALTAYNAAFVAAFNATQHLMDHKLNPIGILESTTHNFWNAFKRIGLVFSPGYLLTANGITNLALGSYTVPVFAVNALPTGFINAYKPIPEPNNKPANDNLPQPANDNYSSPQQAPSAHRQAA